MTNYLCTRSVYTQTGGEPTGEIPFVEGRVYRCTGTSGRDFVLINESGGEHLVSEKFLKERFRVHDATTVNL